MSTSIKRQKAIAIEYALELGFNESTVHVAWHNSKRFIQPWEPGYGRVTKLVVADKIAKRSMTTIGLIVQNEEVVEEFDPTIDCRNWKRIESEIRERLGLASKDRHEVLIDHLPPKGFTS